MCDEHTKKGECIFILNRKIMYLTKKGLKFTFVVGFGFAVISGILFSMYKPAYKARFNGQDFGYIESKKQIENAIEEYRNYKEGNIAFITVDDTPEYEFTFVKRAEETNEENLLIAVRENATIVYRTYAITLDGETKAYVNSIDEAETVINEIKEKHQKDIELNIAIQEVFTENSNDIDAVEVAIATANLENSVATLIKQKTNSVNGVLLSTPTKGTVTSRYGARWGRSHNGIDVGAATGTPIYAAASGTITNASTFGGYGQLIKINHGNGVETYYGHCSKIYVKVGQQVETGDLIGLVGSTGNSTGPHLHFEVRVNGVPQNPQNYLYK